MNSYFLEKLGSLMAGGGIAYATYVATKNMPMNDIMQYGFRQILLQRGPIEVCAAGILLWLIGKWRNSLLRGNK